MINAKIKTASARETTTLDADLPFLASEAVVDLSNLISGQSKEMEAILELSKKLKNSIKKGSSGTPLRSVIDLATLTIVSGAAAKTSVTNPPSRKIDELLVKALDIAEFLSSEDIQQKPDKLEEAMNFCVALSQAAITYRQSIRDLRPSHPFRR